MVPAKLGGRAGRRVRGLPRNKTSASNRAMCPTPIGVVSVDAESVPAIVTYDQPVRLSGVPQYALDDAAGSLPTGVMQTGRRRHC